MTKKQRMEHKRGNALRRTQPGLTKQAENGLAPIEAYERWDQRIAASTPQLKPKLSHAEAARQTGQPINYVKLIRRK